MLPNPFIYYNIRFDIDGQNRIWLTMYEDDMLIVIETANCCADSAKAHSSFINITQNSQMSCIA